jgi:hypothetical protein
MRASSEVIDTVAECLTEKCSDCTGFYINRLFQHHLQCMHGCHKLKAMMLGQVGHQESNINLHTPSSVKGEANEH